MLARGEGAERLTGWSVRPIGGMGVASHTVVGMGDRQLSDHIPAFLDARSYRPASIRQRRGLLAQFVDRTGDPRARDLTVELVLGWWSSLAPLRPASRKAHLGAVRVFVRHLRAIGAVDGDPTLAIEAPSVPRPEPVTLTAAEIVRLLAGLPTARDRCMVALMLGCALRGGEVASLNVEDVDLDARVLTVLGKGGQSRFVPMPTAAVECVTEWLAERPATSGPLVRRVDSEERLSVHQLRQRVTRLLADAGIKRSAWDGRSPHALRRTCASELLESGASLRDVQTVLGHRSLASTEHYLRRPDRARLQRVIEQGPLREKAPGPGGPGAVTGRGAGRIMSSLDAS